MLLVIVIGMMLFAMPPIGISTRVVVFRVRPKRWIWVGLGAQGV